MYKDVLAAVFGRDKAHAFSDRKPLHGSNHLFCIGQNGLWPLGLRSTAGGGTLSAFLNCHDFGNLMSLFPLTHEDAQLGARRNSLPSRGLKSLDRKEGVAGTI